MLSKAEKTKIHIIETASLLFNKKGYASTSMSDILEATGLSKGGVYGNFKSKEEIALEAFKYNVSLVFEKGQLLVNNSELTSIEKLYSILKLHEKSVTNPKLEGGCPILNAAIEADDNNPILREKVVQVLNNWQQSLEGIITEGIGKKEIKEDIDPGYYAGLFISLIEGGIMLSKIHRNPKYIENNVKEIKKIIIRALVNS